MTTANLTETDVRVKDAVLQQLEWDPEVDASAIGVASVPRVQPSIATRPSRASIATASRSPTRSTAQARNASSSAAVPMRTRDAPAARAALTSSSVR